MNRTIPKKAVTLSVDPSTYAQIRASGVNVSALLDRAMKEELKSQAAARWKEENREALEGLNRFSEKHGLFSDLVRKF